MKHCPRCGQDKPREAFGRNRACSDGLQTYCRDCKRAHDAEYRASLSPERRQQVVAYMAQYYREHPAEWKAYANRRRELHGEELAAYHKRYFDARYATDADYRDRHRAHVINHTATRRGGRHLTPDEITELVAKRRAATACAYCGAPIDGNDYEFDHMKPLGRGGVNELANIAIVCPPCNQHKHNRTAAEWLAVLNERNAA